MSGRGLEPREELLELLAEQRENALNPDQQERLHHLLSEHAELRRVFVQERLIDAAFHLETPGGAGELGPELAVASSAPKSFPWRTVRDWRWLAASAALFLIGLSVGELIPFSERTITVEEEELTDDGIALLTQALDVEWSGSSSPAEGSILSAGTLKLEQGLAQIEFYSGTRLILEGPAEIELKSVDQVICHLGKLRALVPPSARGFTVLSSQFELVDLGTEFGIEVGATGGARVEVFDGEVEVYPPDGRRAPEELTRLLGGSGLSWSGGGKVEPVQSAGTDFTSFEEVQHRFEQRSLRRFRRWREWSRAVSDDPRLVAMYDFEGGGERLSDRSSSRHHGVIVGSERTVGRWQRKGALEFKRPGDRVRLDIPGEFEALTLTAWIRVDALPTRRQSLLLTDGYELGHVHWQIGPAGELRFGTRVAHEGSISSGSATEPLFTPRRIGTWSLVCATYDRKAGVVRHYLNGQEISQDEIAFDQALKIGRGDIGNWSSPLSKGRNAQPLRNFIGRMDEVTLWRVALSSDEIDEMHSNTRP